MSVTQAVEAFVLAVPGPSLDVNTTKAFKERVGPFVALNTKLVLDMREVQFVDSAGLGAILSCLRQLSAKGGEMKVFGLSKPVRCLFELVRMHRVVDIYNTKEEAISTFAD